MSREDTAWQIADREIKSEEAEYRDDNLLVTDRDTVCQRIANDIMEAFDCGQAPNLSIQLYRLDEELEYRRGGYCWWPRHLSSYTNPQHPYRYGTSGS